VGVGVCCVALDCAALRRNGLRCVGVSLGVFGWGALGCVGVCWGQGLGAVEVAVEGVAGGGLLVLSLRCLLACALGCMQVLGPGFRLLELVISRQDPRRPIT